MAEIMTNCLIETRRIRLVSRSFILRVREVVTRDSSFCGTALLEQFALRSNEDYAVAATGDFIKSELQSLRVAVGGHVTDDGELVLVSGAAQRGSLGKFSCPRTYGIVVCACASIVTVHSNTTANRGRPVGDRHQKLIGRAAPSVSVPVAVATK